ncbi:proline--tRNA ligase [Thermaerobacter litoralis]
MRWTRLLIPTLRDDPAEAEIASHRLMLRAGLIRRVTAGIYEWLPLGRRAVMKVEAIVREEMNRKGGLEVGLPIVQPAELWRETGRWAEYGEEMWRLKDRHGREYCLGPTHEEIITDLVRATVTSYRQLPLLLYQIQNKYRDEIRPRFGVMRAREFVMKDAYSFDVDAEGLERSYQAMDDAYRRIFSRCGLIFRPVAADPGAIGGSGTHEFMALADYGEALIVYCDGCGYAANVEKASSRVAPPMDEAPRPLEKRPTPGVRTIAQLAEAEGIPPERQIKILFYWAVYEGRDPQLVAALVRGDRELNEVKLKNATGALLVKMATREEVLEVAGAPTGSAGPVGLKGVPVLADEEVMGLRNTACGANEEGYHFFNVNPGRDFTPDRVTDLRLVGPGDPCPECGTPMASARGIEVGQIFKLWTKYSEALGCTFKDADGQERPMVMGCYGIGVTRTVAAVIEQHHDEKGIIWPMSVAPYHVVVTPVNYAEPDQRQAAERVYGELLEAGVEAVLDDRDERPGVKFNDADLIGFPLRVTVGPRGLAEGKVEVVERASGAAEPVPVDQAAAEVARRVRAALDELNRRDGSVGRR